MSFSGIDYVVDMQPYDHNLTSNHVDQPFLFSSPLEYLVSMHASLAFIYVREFLTHLISNSVVNVHRGYSTQDGTRDIVTIQSAHLWSHLFCHPLCTAASFTLPFGGIFRYHNISLQNHNTLQYTINEILKF